ncbi:hypothetical protein KIW84_035641 [Lathyrus oleraceus]|uniref:Glucosyltransferase 24 catalytic domain-containing protein n=1 Tax=Pisum sativum TaxID=3888 RepID=A0A9D4Y1P7_PEA|nr:hypothetical protein KIW84_035641 [Pisum sativum]
MGELYDMDSKGKPLAYTPFCDNNKEMDGYRFWRQSFWKVHAEMPAEKLLDKPDLEVSLHLIWFCDVFVVLNRVGHVDRVELDARL